MWLAASFKGRGIPCPRRSIVDIDHPGHRCGPTASNQTSEVNVIDQFKTIGRVESGWGSYQPPSSIGLGYRSERGMGFELNY